MLGVSAVWGKPFIKVALGSFYCISFVAFRAVLRLSAMRSLPVEFLRQGVHIPMPMLLLESWQHGLSAGCSLWNIVLGIFMWLFRGRTIPLHCLIIWDCTYPNSDRAAIPKPKK